MEQGSSKNLHYFDISPLIAENTAVFPGDTAFQRKIALDFSKGDNLLLSSISSTLHIGAHADAPNHYHKDGKSIADRELHYYLGQCEVISVNLPRGARIRPKDIAKVKAKRVLLKTNSYPNPAKWTGDFNSLSAELVENLANQGVLLVGIDTPSIDPSDDKNLESHSAVFKHDMAVLEGIVLQHVPDGLYSLIALPLKLERADASPVRAILLPERESNLWKS